LKTRAPPRRHLNDNSVKSFCLSPPGMAPRSY
jgi:hypothetical protein